MSIHLHTRSYYTLLNSTISIQQLVLKSKELGFSHVSLCDKNIMHGPCEFFKLCRANDIKPIIGLEFDIEIETVRYPFILLAKNNNGFLNLIKLSSYLTSEADYCTLDNIKDFSDDCFLIAYGEGGYVESGLITEDNDEVYKNLLFLKENLPEFDMALSYNETSFWKLKNNTLKSICKNLSIKTVALSKIYYLNSSDDYALKVLQGIDQQKVIKDKTLTLYKGRHLRSKQEMIEIYDKEDLDRTLEIANSINVDYDFNKTSLPKFNTNSTVSSKEYLKQLCNLGLKKRFNNKQVPLEYIDRLKYELEVITNMNFEDYFLIVWDFILFSRKHGIYVGPGRGSASGSLVSYCLGITHIDPIKYNLLFERFLNPERISMPDIDIDFPDNRRDEVINYVYQTYGKNHIAHIVTFGTLKAKQVIRDVGRVLDINLREIDMISKSIPNVLNITLKGAYAESNRFKQIIDSDKRFKELFEIALKLEGMPRHTSTHAAGIVMSNLSLNDVIPTMKIEPGMLTTQYTMEHLESLGLIKMDFLGLKNLTIIDEISNKIKLKDTSFDIMKIPLNDFKTFELLKNVDTVGVFQLESEGMKSLIRKMKPDKFEEIVATIALFRPGPMENIPLYLERRANKDKIEYPHDKLIPILKETYGIMIYQEQIMQTAQIMAGFSLAKADILRKAMSKKNAKELKNLEEQFIEGCISNGHTLELATNLFALIFKFAGYGFNKAHSVAYGLLAYQLAYLKANYPLEFFCCLLNSVINDEIKTSQYIDQCRRRKINILQPDVNISGFDFTIENNNIRYPLSGIKNVGSNAVSQIIISRNNGLFKDYHDFVARMIGQRVNKKILESLIDAGALDNFYNNRRSMIASLDEAISYSELVKVEVNGEVSIRLDLVSKPLMILIKEDELEKSEREKNVLGFYLGKHPIITIKNLYNINCDSLVYLKQKKGYVKGFGIIKKVKQIRTKKGALMSFVSINDETSEMELVIMPNKHEQYLKYLIKGNYIYFDGKIEREDSCVVNNIKLLERN